jgi:hypothetical protein
LSACPPAGSGGSCGRADRPSAVEPVRGSAPSAEATCRQPHFNASGWRVGLRRRPQGQGEAPGTGQPVLADGRPTAVCREPGSAAPRAAREKEKTMRTAGTRLLWGAVLAVALLAPARPLAQQVPLPRTVADVPGPASGTAGRLPRQDLAAAGHREGEVRP